MAYSKCSATFCGYNKHNIKRRKLHVMFHKFPGDRELCRKWIRFCKQHENWQPKPTSAICSTHFREQDYQMVNSPLVKVSSLRKLKIDAIPTIVKGVAIPIAKRLKLDEQRRKHLMKTLYNKDITTTDHEDNSIQEEFDQSKHKATAYDKIVYRLHKFPNVCAFCYKTIEDESLFFSVSLYHVKLQCTIEEKFDEITGAPKDNE
uniref:THAP-type domain-containing protein n=1 Tax=Anopheles dirus TaxID=7168 RepID=A0A182NJT6_9DIPT